MYNYKYYGRSPKALSVRGNWLSVIGNFKCNPIPHTSRPDASFSGFDSTVSIQKFKVLIFSDDHDIANQQK